MGGGEDVLGIGRKLDVLAVELSGEYKASYGSMRSVPDCVMTFCEGLQALAGGRIPYAAVLLDKHRRPLGPLNSH